MSGPRILVIMGSGETAPTMVKVHRKAIDCVGRGNVRAVMLDTPFGFQENADELCAKTIEFFSVSLQTDLEIASLRSADLGPLAIEQGLERVRSANYVFAGPGSPTYALRQWQAIPAFRQVLVERLNGTGAMVFSSAASLTLGTRTLPVYEVYKAGASPYWLDGLDLLGTILPGAIVVPHFDNAEGGGHDTRFCYMGERRLVALETELADDEYVFGVDEHTAALIDLEANTIEIIGKGAVSIRRRGATVRFEAGSTYAVNDVLSAGTDVGSVPTESFAHVGGDADGGGATADATSSSAMSIEDLSSAPTLAAATEVCAQSFREALSDRNADRAVASVLALDDAIGAWASDPGHNDHPERARAALRGCIVQLGGAATGGLADPDDALRPVLAVLLKLRAVVRSEKRFDMSDLIRDELAAIDIEVRDTPEGAIWVRKS
jgi:hypothetical protein